MKKIMLLVLAFLFSAQAEITQKQLEEYMKVSLAGTTLDALVETSTKTVLSQYGYKEENIDSNNLSRIKSILYGSKYISQYTKELIKISQADYRTIMSFYNTSIGKKYKTILPTTLLADMDTNSSLDINTSIDTTFSRKKEILIFNILDELKVIEYTFEVLMKLEIYTRNTLPKKYSVLGLKVESVKSIKNSVNRNKVKILSLRRSIGASWFRHLTERDLENILVYSATDAAKTEYRAIVFGCISYMLVLIDDLMGEQAEKINKMLKSTQ